MNSMLKYCFFDREFTFFKAAVDLTSNSCYGDADEVYARRNLILDDQSVKENELLHQNNPKIPEKIVNFTADEKVKISFLDLTL